MRHLCESLPPAAISEVGGIMRIDRKKCISCFCCHELCSSKAVRIVQPFWAGFCPASAAEHEWSELLLGLVLAFVDRLPDSGLEDNLTNPRAGFQNQGKGGHVAYFKDLAIVYPR